MNSASFCAVAFLVLATCEQHTLPVRVSAAVSSQVQGIDGHNIRDLGTLAGPLSVAWYPTRNGQKSDRAMSPIRQLRTRRAVGEYGGSFIQRRFSVSLDHARHG